MIKLENISKSFDEKVVLDKFNYQFEVGKSYALIGSSGSGKTTLLNIIGKLELPNSGEVKINNTPLKQIKEKVYFKDEVGYLFQNFGLIDNESIEKNLELAFVGRKIPKSEKKDQMNSALRKVNLDLDLNRKIFSLSGGEAQRIALAKLIIKNPPIILADEPTAALDLKNSEELMQLLISLKSEKRVIIIATHNPMVWKLTDEVLNLNDRNN